MRQMFVKAEERNADAANALNEERKADAANILKAEERNVGVANRRNQRIRLGK